MEQAKGIRASEATGKTERQAKYFMVKVLKTHQGYEINNTIF